MVCIFLIFISFLISVESTKKVNYMKLKKKFYYYSIILESKVGYVAFKKLATKRKKSVYVISLKNF